MPCFLIELLVKSLNYFLKLFACIYFFSHHIVLLHSGTPMKLISLNWWQGKIINSCCFFCRWISPCYCSWDYNYIMGSRFQYSCGYDWRYTFGNHHFAYIVIWQIEIAVNVLTSVFFSFFLYSQLQSLHLLGNQNIWCPIHTV